MQFIATELDHDSSYKLLTGAVVPRPIAWVTSGTEPGKINLAPFSTFTFVSPWPPMVGFNCGLRGQERKDTSRNIHAVGDYVVNIADESLLEAMHLSSGDHAPDVSEVDLAGLHTVPSVMIKTPRLAEAPISMECRLNKVISFGKMSHEFFVGEVVMFHVRDDIYKNGKIDTRLLRPICRLGGPNYATLGEIITLAAPSAIGVSRAGGG
jgi:flavin reductase (DIM6/NTAB) family NADH-FMN oxidoreductase RutF